MRRAWSLALAACSIIGAAGVLKGLAPAVVPGSEFYWLATYRHGFVRRAFIGTLIHPLVALQSFDRVEPAIVALHALTCLAVIGACAVLFNSAIADERSTSIKVTLTLAFLVLMSSPWLPTLAHDVGYVDIYLAALALAAFWLILHERYVAAALTAAVGPLVHEAFIFVWLPVALVLGWSAATLRTDVRGKLTAILLPVASTLVVAFLESDAATAQMIDALPVSTSVRDGLQAYQLRQTLGSSLHEMVTRQIPGNMERVEIAAPYFLAPSAAMLWAAIFCYRSRWQAPWTTMLVLAAATFAPLAILALAWDLSRFFVMTNLAAAFVLIAAGSRHLTRTA